MELGLLALVAADGAVGVPVRPTAVALRGATTARAQARKLSMLLSAFKGLLFPLGRWLRITVFQLANQLKFLVNTNFPPRILGSRMRLEDSNSLTGIQPTPLLIQREVIQ